MYIKHKISVFRKGKFFSYKLCFGINAVKSERKWSEEIVAWKYICSQPFKVSMQLDAFLGLLTIAYKNVCIVARLITCGAQ